MQGRFRAGCAQSAGESVERGQGRRIQEMGWAATIGRAEAGNECPGAWHSHQGLNPEAFQLLARGSFPDFDHLRFPKQIVYVPAELLSLPQMARQASLQAAGPSGAASVKIVTVRESVKAQATDAYLSLLAHIQDEYVSTCLLHVSSFLAAIGHAPREPPHIITQKKIDNCGELLYNCAELSLRWRGGYEQ